MAISAVGEGCHKQMESMLPQIMEVVIKFLLDPVSYISSWSVKCISCRYTCPNINFLLKHPRVRYAACNAIGQMSTDFAPNFQKKFHEKVVPGLLLVLDDNQNPRVQAHAGIYCVQFVITMTQLRCCLLWIFFIINIICFPLLKVLPLSTSVRIVPKISWLGI